MAVKAEVGSVQTDHHVIGTNLRGNWMLLELAETE